MIQQCPACNTTLKLRTSTRKSEMVKTLFYVCPNYRCKLQSISVLVEFPPLPNDVEVLKKMVWEMRESA